MVGIITGNITAAKYLIQRLSELLEGWFVLHVLVLDTCQFFYDLGYCFLWVDKKVTTFFSSVREYFDIGYLNDTVLDEVKARGLQIEYD